MVVCALLNFGRRAVSNVCMVYFIVCVIPKLAIMGVLTISFLSFAWISHNLKFVLIAYFLPEVYDPLRIKRALDKKNVSVT